MEKLYKVSSALAVMLALAITATAQVVVTGTVTDNTGRGTPGVNLVIKGTTVGTATDADGKYSISVPRGQNVLVVSSIGYATKEVEIGNRTVVDIVLEEDISSLSEVVITALGIEKETKSLTYTVQQVSGDNLNVARDANFINGLAGKVPGLVINRSSSGPGGSVRILLRGQKSTGNNSPLIVIDGLPIASTNSTQPGDIWGGRDGGDVLSMINPADIENMSVLKGAAASALYGALGQNGVILISTKKGKAGTVKVDYTTNITAETPLYIPKMQNEYLQTNTDNIYSWGPKGSSPNHVKSFFNTGSTWINNISISTGNEKAQTYFSYSNTSNNGIMPTSTFKQNNFNFRQTAKISDKLSLDGNIILGQQKTHNRVTGGLYFNPLTGLYLFPRGLNFDQYSNYEYASPSRRINAQNWWNINEDSSPKKIGQDNQQNPYWILNRNQGDQTRQNVFASMTLKYAINDWLNVQARGNVNNIVDEYEQKVYATTQGTLTDPNGRYVLQTGNSTVAYSDVILSGDKDLNDDLGVTFNAGASIRHEKFESLNVDSKGSDLVDPNVFTLGSIVPSKSITQLNKGGYNLETQSLFATASLNFKKSIYADLTIRNDWSSSLTNTSKLSSGFLYYGTGLNAIVSELVQMPDFITYFKVRGAYTKVGSGIPPYSTSQTYTYNAGNQVQPNYTPYGELKQEDQISKEIGLELKFLENRLSFDLSLYRIDNKNQFFNISAPRGSGTSRIGLNVGDIQNKGIEASLSYDAIKKQTVSWTTGLNFTRNQNKVTGIPLASGNYAITEPGVNNYGLYLTEGGRFGDIYGKKFQRSPDGRIIVDATGKPLAETTGGLKYLGNPQPKFLLSWNNTVTYKDFVVNLLIDGRFGGKVMSVTQALLDEYGVSKITADDRNNGGVDMRAVISDGTNITGEWNGKLPAETFYTTVGGRAGITEHYMYDATNVRVRELSIGYKLPVTIKYVKSLHLSIIGRNLFFISKKAPYDPELSMSTGNGVQGVDAFALPSTRSLGLSLKCSF